MATITSAHRRGVAGEPWMTRASQMCPSWPTQPSMPAPSTAPSEMPLPLPLLQVPSRSAVFKVYPKLLVPQQAQGTVSKACLPALGTSAYPTQTHLPASCSDRLPMPK